MKKIRFTKMHGLGNDFMVVNAIENPSALTPSQIRQLADRHRGVGFDQLLLIEQPQHAGMDFFYRIFNVDGSEAEQCGNGLRCIVKFIYDKQLTNNVTLRIGTLKGIQIAEPPADGLIRVVMGKPSYIKGIQQFAIGEQVINCFSLGMGNPHTVIQVSDINQAPVADVGSILNRAPEFPQGVNVEFMQIVHPNHIHLRVYERAVGETLACGSGACAAVAAGWLQGLLADKVTVSLPGGELWIEIASDHTITMQGPATTVYEGEIVI